MRAAARRNFRVALSVLLLLAGLLLAVSVDRGAAPATATATSATLFDEPRLAIRLGRNRLQLLGTSASDEHEAVLTSLVSEHFAGAELHADFRAAVNVPVDWETLSARLLYLVAAMTSADAVLQPGGIAIQGITQDEPSYTGRLEFLQSALPAGSTIDAAIDIIPSVAVADLCRQSFSSLHSEPINFRLSSTTIRPSSFAYLDRLAEFTWVCSTPQIAISGHSDATGNEAWNLQISTARAQAVADHLVRTGVAPERLIVKGYGSSQPVADNATVQGRERNRRIEIELR